MKRFIHATFLLLFTLALLAGCSSNDSSGDPGIWVRVENKLYVSGTPRDIRLYSIDGDSFSEYFDNSVEVLYGEVSAWIDIGDGYSSVFSSSITVDFRYWTGSSWSGIVTGELDTISGVTLYDREYHTAPLYSLL